MTDAPTLSICVPTYNRASYVAELLGYLEAEGASFLPPGLRVEAPLGGIEVVVCDNASDDETADVLARAVDRHPWLRWHRQAETVPVEANFASAVRLATGRYCLYLADDDRLDGAALSDVLEFLHADAEMVACYAPYTLKSDAETAGLAGRLSRLPDPDRPSTLSGPEGVNLLLNTLLDGDFFAEIALYRTSALQEVFVAPATIYWSQVVLLRLAAMGKIGYHPARFYLHDHAMTPRQARNATRAGPRAAAVDQDKLRGGLDTALCHALSLMGLPGVDPGHRAGLLEFLLANDLSRHHAAARILLSEGRQDEALEQFCRLLPWLGADNQAEVARWREQVLPGAALQAVARLARQTAGIGRLLIWRAPQAEAMAERLRADLPGSFTVVPLDMIAPADLLAQCAEDCLIITERIEDRAAALDIGVAPGRVLAMEGVADLLWPA